MTALRATVQALPAPGQPPCGSSSLLSYICLRKHSETQTSTKQLTPTHPPVLYQCYTLTRYGELKGLALILGRSRLKVPQLLCSSYLLCDVHLAQAWRFLGPDINLQQCQNVTI